MIKNNLVHIRDAQESERHAIRDLIAAAYAEFEAVISPSMWTTYNENITATIMEEKPLKCIVAVLDETIVGSILLYLSEPATYPVADVANVGGPEMRLLAVLPEMRGQGIASALLNECIARARRAGASFVALHTSHFMQSAVRLYERKGFVRAPETDFYAEGTAVVGYRFPLNDPLS